MSNRGRRSAEERAEARRRARYAAQGRDDELDANDDDDEVAATGAAQSGGGSFLTRLFPPAPPLPGMRDPFAEFRYDGPFRGPVGGLYLLARNPVPWLGLGAIWSAARLMLEFAAAFGGIGSVVAIVASLAAFGGLIAAGWIGWQRPWLFGLMASIVGILMFSGLTEAILAGTEFEFRSGQVFLSSIVQEVAGFQPLFGALAGWYGGYLRRRMAQNVATSRTSRAAGARRR
jgi:hypothetical protein